MWLTDSRDQPTGPSLNAPPRAGRRGTLIQRETQHKQCIFGARSVHLGSVSTLPGCYEQLERLSLADHGHVQAFVTPPLASRTQRRWSDVSFLVLCATTGRGHAMGLDGCRAESYLFYVRGCQSLVNPLPDARRHTGGRSALSRCLTCRSGPESTSTELWSGARAGPHTITAGCQ